MTTIAAGQPAPKGLGPTPTDEQQAAIDATKGTGASILLDALAGTGKTTTLGMVAKQVRGPALALAFNKSIAAAMADRFPMNFDVKTMNGLGYGVLRRTLPNVQTWKIEPKKIGKLITEYSRRRKIDLNTDQWEQVKRLVAAAQNAGIVPGGTPEGLTADDQSSWTGLADDLWIDSDDAQVMIDLAREVLGEANALTQQGIISFDDQVYWPTVFGGRWPKYPMVLVDEAQDLNGLNHAILRAVGAGRLIACGDPRQSIYGFRGSVTQSMKRIRQIARPQWTDLELTLTFRCPKAVVERQLAHAPHYRAAASNPDGLVLDWTGPEYERNGWDFANIAAVRPHSMASMAVLCRNNAPLLVLAFKCLRRGIGVAMLGSDLGKGLTALVRKVCGDGDPGIAEVVELVKVWAQTESTAATLVGNDEKIAGIMDRAESVIAVAEGSGAQSASGLCKAIDTLFARTDGLVTLSTIHRAKGLEWDLVMHLDPWRIPSKYARKALALGDDRQMEQERNLRYVCETRTKSVLVLANIGDFGTEEG